MLSNWSERSGIARAKDSRRAVRFTKPGAVFGGWFADKALTKPWDTQHDAVQSSMTLYARWL